MTREEAIVNLEKLIALFYTASEQSKMLDYSKVIETLEFAAAALRPISREEVEMVWSPCNFCAGAKYITGGVTAVYPLSETRQQETLAEGDFDFCPVCGRPLTDEAVQMVMRRLEALKDGKTD